MAETTQEPSGNHNSHLTLYIVIAIVAAVAFALIAPDWAATTAVGGEIFLRLLQMVVVPLVMASVMSGILGLGDVRKLGRPGAMAVGYYLCTTVLAVITGLIVVNIVNPGLNIQKELVEDSRSEGKREVEKTGRAAAEQFTFGYVNDTRLTENGMSNSMPVSDQGTQTADVKITQVGKAQTPAAIRLWTSPLTQAAAAKKKAKKEANQQPEFTAAGDFVSAEVEAGSYPIKLPIPAGAHRVKLEFRAAEGGTLSLVEAELTEGPPTIGHIFHNLVLMLFTDNLLESMVDINLLPLIVFSIVFAGMLTTMGAQSGTISDLVLSINAALMNFILLLMKVAPLGIFCLVAARFGKAQAEGKFVELLQVQSYYIVTVLVGLSVHAFLTLPGLLWFFTRRNPFKFMGQMSQALLTAFSTASSTATLPVTMECAETKAGVSRRSVDFVLPLGATINMDGTALYEAAAAIFIAQAYAVIDPNFSLTFADQAVIAVTATLAAIGAAGIPEAGLVTMLIVLNAVNLPVELIGLILPVDWLLDRFRTAVNCFGDAVGSAVVDNAFQET